jgi:hypothetical protein
MYLTVAGISPLCTDATGANVLCDISLDYIKFEPIAASLLCDRMEEMMEQTGENGFHYVDEARPSCMRALLEILRRKLSVTVDEIDLKSFR